MFTMNTLQNNDTHTFKPHVRNRVKAQNLRSIRKCKPATCHSTSYLLAALHYSRSWEGLLQDQRNLSCCTGQNQSLPCPSLNIWHQPYGSALELQWNLSLLLIYWSGNHYWTASSGYGPQHVSPAYMLPVRTTKLSCSSVRKMTLENTGRAQAKTQVPQLIQLSEKMPETLGFNENWNSV